MKVPISRIRNIGIIAHIDAGKTTTTERMLFYSGLTSRIGNVDQGDTVTDFLPAERARGITIQSAAITIPWNSHRINLIDTPGHADFTFEVIRSLKVLDGVVTILDAVAGVEAQTEKVWKQSMATPKLIFVNKMDREGAGYGRTVKEIVAKLGTKVLLCNVPLFSTVGRQPKFTGVLDVVNQKVIRWDEGDKVSVEEPEGDSLAEITKCRESLVETLGEVDEAVVDAFLETEDYMKIPNDLIQRAIRKSTLENHAVPVLCGASFKNIGVQPLMDAVNSYLPSPVDITPDLNTALVLNKENGFQVKGNDKLSIALAFKVTTDPIRGVMVFVRVYTGKLVSNSTIYVHGEPVKIGKLLIMNANVPQEVSEITAGNIGVIVSDKIKTGDTILFNTQKKKIKDTDLVVNPIEVPPPVFTISLEPRTSGDKRSMDDALEVLLREDPSLKVTVDEESGQTLLSGMGELHLEIAKGRLDDLKAKVELGKIMVSYKETILEKASGEKEQDGVKLSISIEQNPQEASKLAKNMRYVDLSDHNYLAVPYEPKDWNLHKLMPYETLTNAIISGTISSIQRGPILKLPLHSVLVTIDSIDVADDFQDATVLINVTRQLFAQLLSSSDNFNIMEPMMKVSVEVSPEDIGSVIQDLTSVRKGVIDSIDEDEASSSLAEFKLISENQYVPYDPTLEFIKLRTDFTTGQKINAQVPLKEMIGYLPKLRALTQGRATYHMEFKGMEQVTAERMKEIVEEY